MWSGGVGAQADGEVCDNTLSHLKHRSPSVVIEVNSAAIEAIAKNDGIVVLLVGIRLSGEKIEPSL